MNYTLITMWETLDGTYYSSTANYNGYDDAVGNYHAKFKPMQNDQNVAAFTLFLIDEYANKVERCSWTRTVVQADETAE